jgi:hypothetical protein
MQHLSILDFSEGYLGECFQELMKTAKPLTDLLGTRIEMLMGESCKLVGGKKGRKTAKSREKTPKGKACTVDLFYYYQLAAWKKYGNLLYAVSPTKSAQGDLTISHLCGTRLCCELKHIILEPKWLNDIRTSHHTTLRNILGNADLDSKTATSFIKEAKKNGACLEDKDQPCYTSMECARVYVMGGGLNVVQLYIGNKGNKA